MSTSSKGFNALRILFVVAGKPTSSLARVKRIQQFANGLQELGSAVSILYLDNEHRDDAKRNLQWSCDGNVSFMITRAKMTASPVLRKFFGNFIDGRTIAEAFDQHKKRFCWNCVFHLRTVVSISAIPRPKLHQGWGP